MVVVSSHLEVTAILTCFGMVILDHAVIANCALN
jgi:hypothetical protein